MKLKKQINKIIFLLLSIVIINMALPMTAQAEPIISEGTLGSSCYNEGDCGLNDFLRIIESSYTTIFGFIGSIALIMFIIGGVLFLISGGNQEKVTKAKKLMISAVIGLLIIFASYLIIEFVLNTVGYTNVDNWSTSP